MAAAQQVVLPLDGYLEVTEGHGVLRDQELPESHAPRGADRACMQRFQSFSVFVFRDT